MASTITGSFNGKLTITETLASGDVPNLDASDPALKFALGEVANISGVTAIASMTQALSGGAATIDLTSLTHRGVSVSFSGLKVKYLALYNPSANVITLVEGASNGNALLGSSFSLSVQPGDYQVFHLAASQTVGGSDKTIDLSGTGSQTLKILMGAG